MAIEADCAPGEGLMLGLPSAVPYAERSNTRGSGTTAAWSMADSVVGAEYCFARAGEELRSRCLQVLVPQKGVLERNRGAGHSWRDMYKPTSRSQMRMVCEVCV